MADPNKVIYSNTSLLMGSNRTEVTTVLEDFPTEVIETKSEVSK